MRQRITEHTHGRIGQRPATARCGNDFTSSCLVRLGAGDHAIGSPTGHFMYGLAELGGVRLII